MEFEDLRRKIGRLVGHAIGEGQIRQVLQERQRMGAFTDSIDKIVIEILEYLEAKDAESKNHQPNG